ESREPSQRHRLASRPNRLAVSKMSIDWLSGLLLTALIFCAVGARTGAAQKPEDISPRLAERRGLSAPE
ncbi:MAG TPA: hypothetical protein VMS23_00485, partial [Terrimicrobiaceae bacterium]|nr:hypothetical protein [Terrimicrobiaceae bacterium]